MTYPLEIWEDADYRGLSAKLDYRTYWNINQTGLPNDSISSLKVGPFTKVSLYDDISAMGQVITIVGPREIPSLANFAGGMNDRISSIIVARIEPDITTKMQCCQGISSGINCGEFAGGAVCDNVMTEYCTTHMGETICQAWCKDHPAKCDGIVSMFCATDPGNPYCACINSPAQVNGIINPKCVDRKCLNTGYLTTAMINTNCPAQINCEVKNTLINTGVILSNTVPVQQNCGGAPVVEPTPEPETSAPAFVWSYQLIFIILLVFIIFMVLVGAAVFFDWSS